MIRRALLPVFLILLFIIFNAFLNPIPEKNTIAGFKPSYGVTYSFEQAGWYNLNAKKSYADLLDNLKVDWVRLPFFWDQMTQLRRGSDGQAEWGFNERFEDLIFAVKEAQKRNVNVIIALGAKTPYYPEYHLPDKIKSQLKFGNTIRVSDPIGKDILDIDKKVIEELSIYDNIVYWQIENEPYLANINNWKIDRSLIEKEVEIVRGTDSRKRPIILNHVAPSVFDRRWQSLLSTLKPGDVLGVNAYFKTQGVYLASFKLLGKEFHLQWPVWLVWPVQSWLGFSPDFRSLKNEAEEKGINLWVLEMQAEPYIRILENAKREKYSYSPWDVVMADRYLRSFQIESVGLWGAPFWQYREKMGDNSWINAAKAIVGN